MVQLALLIQSRKLSEPGGLAYTTVRQCCPFLGFQRHHDGSTWSNLKSNVVVDAALGLFAASMICYLHPQFAVGMSNTSSLTTGEWQQAFRQAIETLQTLDRGNKIIDKCIGCLVRLEQVLTYLRKSWHEGRQLTCLSIHCYSRIPGLIVLIRTGTASLNNNNNNGSSTTDHLNELPPFEPVTPLSPTLWSANGPITTDGQPSFLDFDGLFNSSIPPFDEIDLGQQ